MSRQCRFPLTAGLCFALALMLPTAARAATRPVPSTPATIKVYASVLHHYNPQLPGWQSQELARHLLSSAQRWNIDTNMLVAIVSVESRWHTHAISSAGAIGLGQLMPGTAATLGVNPHNPAQNLQGAARYLRGLMERFDGRPDRYALVFAAYNAGPIAVERYGGIPPYYETQQYVVKVLHAWHELQRSIHFPASVFATALALPRGADIQYWLGDGKR
jgi:soluble lytic murein transglycosylase-like protein